MVSVVIGWDIGGAHLKAARVKDGRVEAVVQAATPLWLGLDSLHAAFDALNAQLGRADRHVITMTGELCDAFPSRREGVAGLAADRRQSSQPCSPEPLRRPGRVRRARRSRFPRRRHRLGQLARKRRARSLSSFRTRCSSTSARRQQTSFPIVGGQVATIGYTDAERLAAGELVYTGMTRSFVMSLASRAPFRGAWTPLMNEYFASSADVHRILGDLPDDADKMSTADGREKTVEASRARLARMIGREADEGSTSEWAGLAAWFAEAQMRQITDAALLRLSRNDVAVAAPVVAAGVGEGLAAEAARRLRRPCLGFSSLISAPAEASHCAPAVAVALLGAKG